MRIRITIETLDDKNEGNPIWRNLEVSDYGAVDIGDTANDMLGSLLSEF